MPAAPDRSHAREMDRAEQSCPGAEFDKQYMAYTLSDHTQGRVGAQEGAGGAKDSDVKAFARQDTAHTAGTPEIRAVANNGVQQTSSRVYVRQAGRLRYAPALFARA